MDMIARAEQCAGDLIDTCKALSDEASADELLNSVFCARLDELVFECTVCNWWHAIDELGNGESMICLECEPVSDV